MTTPALYRKTMEAFGRQVAAVSDDQWGDPVPCCPDWDVRQLVAHVTEEALWVQPLLTGGADDDTEERIAQQVHARHPVALWDRAAHEAIEAVEDPGALDRRVQLPEGESSGSEYVAEVFADTLIHTWDLTRAIGGDGHLDPDAVAACTAWFDQHEHEWRQRGAIGDPAPIPEHADAQTRLLARFGRQA